MLSQRCLVLDIETAPNLVYVFDLKDQNIGLQQVKKEWYVLAWGAKWLNAPVSEFIYRETRNGNDKRILQELWKLLDKADIVITQNGKGFDGPKIEARMMLHGMKPPSPYKHYDVYLSNRNKGFLSHRLDYLTHKLNRKYKKLDHGKFPGWKLWIECLEGNKEAWKELRKYNTYDVLSTEELYLNTREWAPSNMPSPMLPIDHKPRCPYCGAYLLRSLGRRNRYRRYICKLCGKMHQEAVA